MNDPALHAALDDIATINAFFVLEPASPGADLRPVSDLWLRPDLLASEIADTRQRLAALAGVRGDVIEKRVAASLLYQGVATRVLSPLVGALVWHGRGPDPAALRWSPQRQGPLALVLSPDAASVILDTNGAQAAASLVSEHAIEGVLAPIGAALRAQVTVAPRLLWGNVASALAGATAAVAAARPCHRAGAYALARLVLERAPLVGLGAFAGPDTEEPPRFERGTCCLYYRVPRGSLCGDCVLAATRRTSRSAPRN